MSRRRVKEMLRQEYNRNKNKDFSHDDEDDVSLASMLKKQSEKKEIVEVPTIIKPETPKTIDLTPIVENNVTTFLDNLDKPIEKITTPRNPHKEEERKDLKSIDDELKQLEKTNKEDSESEDSHSDSESSHSEDSRSDSESSHSESSESSEDDYEYRKRQQRRDDRKDDRRYDRRDDRRREEEKRREEERKREEEKKKEEERKREEESRRKVEEKRKSEDRKRDEGRKRDEERKHKKEEYSEDAVRRDDRRRYEDEPKQRSRPRHVRERSKERRAIIDNSFKNVSQKVLLKMLKREDIESVSSNIYDSIVDVMYKFTEAIILELAEEVKIITTNHVELIMEFYIEDEEKELPKNAVMDTEDFKDAIIKIVTKHSIGIRSNAVYSLQLFIECVIGKVIKGAGIVAKSSKRARATGDDLYAAFEIYML